MTYARISRRIATMSTQAPQLTSKMALVQDRLGEPLRGYLERGYWERRRTFQELAADIHERTQVSVGLRTLTDWFRHFEIATSHRKPEEREAMAS